MTSPKELKQHFRKEALARRDNLDPVWRIEQALHISETMSAAIAVEPGQVVSGYWPMRSEAVIKGDDKVPAISAASILAKVTRDRQLIALHEEFPQYGFDEHVGYGTPRHLEALRRHGPSPHHRQSFAPVREAFEMFGALTVSRVIRSS